ncbi:hypothetical protein TRFO_06202 [Tritrichomonas foetus]|uniref:Uncharacterized protein n=1 Tax=Tritrichomonas foetus TaxID=1144522 RepID=A0A1J4K1U5_9EUKA|nr:hypothetical protein TRFO_06202 [Tritrichomonas foetus]|eukprot:OHT04760.1 hypothetical protein TRFO_06202 [Tritrichomonas foetus]
MQNFPNPMQPSKDMMRPQIPGMPKLPIPITGNQPARRGPRQSKKQVPPQFQPPPQTAIPPQIPQQAIAQLSAQLYSQIPNERKQVANFLAKFIPQQQLVSLWKKLKEDIKYFNFFNRPPVPLTFVQDPNCPPYLDFYNPNNNSEYEYNVHPQMLDKFIVCTILDCFSATVSSDLIDPKNQNANLMICGKQIDAHTFGDQSYFYVFRANQFPPKLQIKPKWSRPTFFAIQICQLKPRDEIIKITVGKKIDIPLNASPLFVSCTCSKPYNFDAVLYEVVEKGDFVCENCKETKSLESLECKVIPMDNNSHIISDTLFFNLMSRNADMNWVNKVIDGNAGNINDEFHCPNYETTEEYFEVMENFF